MPENVERIELKAKRQFIDGSFKAKVAFIPTCWRIIPVSEHTVKCLNISVRELKLQADHTPIMNKAVGSRTKLVVT